jgi:hypothetical protein
LAHRLIQTNKKAVLYPFIGIYTDV